MSKLNETAETVHNAGKVALADHLRLMGGNQRTLNATNADDQRHRDLHGRIEEAKAKGELDNLAKSPELPAGEETMHINVDSPVTRTTHNHYSLLPAEPQGRATPKPSSVAGKLGKAALLAALLGSGLGGGLAIPWALHKLSPPAAEMPTDTTTQIEIE